MSGDDGWQNPLSDEPYDFDAALKALTDGTAGKARFHELSAAERAKQASRQARKAQRRAGGQRRPSDQRMDGDQQQADGQRRPSQRSLSAMVIALFSIAFVGVIGFGAYAVFGGRVAIPAGTNAATQPSVTTTVLTRSPTPLYGPPPDPFAGTPAADWANGAAGIVIPSAKAVGSFSAAQVASAYQATGQLLIAANLDKTTLLGGSPTAFAALLTKEQRTTFLDGLDAKGVSKTGYPLSTRTWVASFAPGSATLVGDVIKVSGTMTAAVADDSGKRVLAIDVNYLFAYAVEPPDMPTDWIHVVDHQYGTFDFAQWDDPGGPLEAWDQTFITNAGAQCGTTDGFIHPAYPTLTTPTPTDSAPPVNPYSTATPPTPAACPRPAAT